MEINMNMKLFGMAAVAALIATSLSTDAMARQGRGADDPVGHVRGEGKGHALIMTKKVPSLQIARRGRGADDPAGHVRGEGAGHA
jgi:hypothetical protein